MWRAAAYAVRRVGAALGGGLPACPRHRGSTPQARCVRCPGSRLAQGRLCLPVLGWGTKTRHRRNEREEHDDEELHAPALRQARWLRGVCRRSECEHAREREFHQGSDRRFGRPTDGTADGERGFTNSHPHVLAVPCWDDESWMKQARSKSHPLNGTSVRSPTRSRAERARGFALTSSSLAVIGCRVTGAQTASDLP